MEILQNFWLTLVYIYIYMGVEMMEENRESKKFSKSYFLNLGEMLLKNRSYSIFSWKKV